MEKNDILQKTLDNINLKFGTGTIANASELKNKD